MFSINNMFFLLTDLAANYSKQTQQKLIVPGVIFSLGAIMLIVCVLVQNINRKRKLQEAEKLKRERIKKFSEEASMRYTQAQPTQEDIDRQNRFLQQSQMIEEQKRREQELIKQQANNSLQQNRMQQQAPQQPQMPGRLPSVPGMQQQGVAPTIPVLPQGNMQAPQVVPTPMQGRPMPNAINPAVPMPGQTSSPTVMPNSEVPTLIKPTEQPSMGGQVLPGMQAASQAVVTEEDDTTNIAELVKKRIAEVENKKREQLSNEGNDTIIEKPQPKEEKPQINPNNEKPFLDVKTSEEEKKEVEKKEEEKKQFKFEYKPDYKPGQEPAEPVKIEIPITKPAEPKEEKEIEVQKISFDPEKDDRKIEEQKEETKPLTSTVKTFDLSGDSEEEKSNDIKEESKEEIKPEEDQAKQPKIILERSETFVQADEQERDVIAKQEAQPVMIERAPVIPKIVTKKIEYNAGYLREVQNKINASREYQESINIKEEQKEELKKELLEKRMNLQRMKAKLQDELKDKEEKEELSKEQISKSLLDKTERGIVYEQGKHISLFDQALIDKVESLDESKEEPKVEEVKVEEPKEEVKQEIKLEEPKVEIKEEPKKEIKLEPIEEVKEEIKEEVVQEEKVVEQKIEEPKEEIIPEVKVEEKIEEPKEEIKEEIKEEVKEQKVENIKDEIIQETSKEKDSSAVLNQIDYLFSSIDDEQKNRKSPQEIELEKKAIERQHREANKDLIKDMVKQTEAMDGDAKPKSVYDDIRKVRDNFRRMEYNQAAKELLNQTKAEEKQEAKENEPSVKPTENLDPIRAKIRAKVEEEKRKKEEQEQALKDKRQEKFDKQNERTKSILGGIDLDAEILASKSKQINSLSDAPSYKKIIVVVSPDSCGKTTIAVNLAYELANRGLKTCLIDTDNIKKDVYYYIHQDKVGCLSRLNEFNEASDMYDVGIQVNDRLTVFTENKGIEYEINYSKLYKLINYAHEVNDTVIIDIKSSLGQEKMKDLLKLSTNILFVIDKKITTLNRIADKFAKCKGGFFNKDVTLVVNMDEGRGINKAAVKSIFKHLEYIDNGEKKSYSIRIGEMFTVMYDTKSIITGLISQEPAVTVKENNIIADIRKIASYFYEHN